MDSGDVNWFTLGEPVRPTYSTHFSSGVDDDGRTWSIAWFRIGRVRTAESYRDLISDYESLDEHQAQYARAFVDQLFTEEEFPPFYDWLTWDAKIPIDTEELFRLPLPSTQLGMPYEALDADSDGYPAHFWYGDQLPPHTLPFQIAVYVRCEEEGEPGQGQARRERTVDEFFRQIISDPRGQQ